MLFVVTRNRLGFHAFVWGHGALTPCTARSKPPAGWSGAVVSELTPLAPQWAALAARALEPNVFYEPAFTLAAAPVLGHDAAAGLVWSRAEPSRLLGFFPVRIERRRYGIALPVLAGWTHSLRAARHAAGRSRSRRARARGLARSRRRRSAASEAGAAALPADARGVRARCFDAALAARGGAAVSFAAPPARPAGAGHGARRLSRPGPRRKKAQGAAAAAASPCRSRHALLHGGA